MTRSVFIVEDLHLLLLAGLPAHYQGPYAMTVFIHSRVVIEAISLR